MSFAYCAVYPSKWSYTDIWLIMKTYYENVPASQFTLLGSEYKTENIVLMKANCVYYAFAHYVFPDINTKKIIGNNL